MSFYYALISPCKKKKKQLQGDFILFYMDLLSKITLLIPTEHRLICANLDPDKKLYVVFVRVFVCFGWTDLL